MNYLPTDHKDAASLQTWIDAEGPSPLARELGLARWQLSKLVAIGNQTMVCESYLKLIASLEKQNLILMKERHLMWSPSERKAFLDELQSAIERVLRKYTPDHVGTLLSAIANEFENVPPPQKRIQ